jgi:serine-type D-Ala-D-Ala carboxypeptidase/endopeptidase (penicillin-binding protein 4)
MPLSLARTLLLLALPLSALATSPTGIAPEIEAALARAKIPREAVALLVLDTQPGAGSPRLSHRAQVPMNPASVMKLVTTFAALDLLGPAYVWSTPVYLDGSLQNGTLSGNVYIKGQGDPKLVLERLWLLLRRLQGLGIKHITGDIVLDRSAFEVPEADPASFDGEPLRPYNAAPDALLINYKAVVMTFTPERASNTAQVQFDPPLYGVQMQTSVPLTGTASAGSASGSDCGDYRAALKADFSDARRIRFGGSYNAACGEKVWPVAYADPASYGPRAVQGLWLEMGGKLGGSVHWGKLPTALALGKPALELSSAPLAEVIRDINKYSNNVMAQQLFLTLGRVVGADGNARAGGPVPAPAPAPAPVDAASAVPMASAGEGTGTALSAGSFSAARAVLQRWWRERIGNEDMPLLDNGSGLSRQERISAQGLARLLQLAYRSATMSELMSSLPISGVDGTLKRSKSAAAGSAHLKTGTLSNVLARAGYVDAVSGKRYVLVALINHANANTEGARAVMDSLLDWTIRDN